MKTKLLLTGMLSATLLLGACGTEEKKEANDKKSESAEKKKETPKKDESKKDTAKKDNESTEQTEQVATEEPQSQEQQPVQQEPTEQEKTEANKKWAKENVKGGTDAGMLDPSVQPDSYYSNDQLDPETGLPKDDAVPHKVEQPQEVDNPARDQVINEGIDMDNPTDAEIERMRELAKDSPHGLQSAPSQGGE
ncbi:hypothetical protein [Staphylococcus pseudoxylosus]|uniref:hypothetical protein n=1 Tax=Staphylococcus pseudoxylosus TaxID=2282419 RepID=UPI002DBE8408|nr:hypothetical protein [Staphylococcus pseudoxylosus]MEB6038002.1 hypothetical protein [Staphylococcus pseudoxylosus]